MQLDLLKNPRLDRVLDALMPLIATIAALLIGAIILVRMHTNPIDAYKGLYDGAFGTKNAVADTLLKATPLLLVGIGICISFRGGVINIGGEGQMVVGGLAALAIALEYPHASPALLIPICLITSFVAGAIWGGIAGVLKAYFNVNEILSTIMLNQIANYLMIHLVSNPLIDPKQKERASSIPETARVDPDLRLPRIGPRLDDLYERLDIASTQLWTPTKLHYGVILAMVLAIIIYVFLWRTTIGYRIRAVGKNPRASRYAGIDVKRYTVLSLFLSGGLAGLAGGVEVLGVSYKMSAEAGSAGFTGSAGFNGIVAALFGRLHPVGTIPAAILFGALLVGGNKLKRTVDVPSALTSVLIGMVIVFVVSGDSWRRWARRGQDLMRLLMVGLLIVVPILWPLWIWILYGDRLRIFGQKRDLAEQTIPG